MSSSGGAAAALGVKAHVLYSRLLKADEYWALLGLNSTAEIAGFLKQTEGYKDCLEALPTEKVHRIDLENAVKSSVLAEADSFIFYLQGSLRKFFVDWISRYEAEQLKSIFRWMHSKRVDRGLMRQRLYNFSGSKLPYDALLNCRGYGEILETLRDTKYYKALREPVRRLAEGEQSLFYLELAIDNLVETGIYAGLAGLPQTERRILEPLFGTRVDLLNLYHFHRCVWYYNMTAEETLTHMLPVRYRVNAHHLRNMMRGADADERLGIMGETFPAYAKLFRDAIASDDTELALEMSIRRFNYLKALSVLRDGVPGFHTAVAYFILKDHEVTDIIRMIEDVRYDYDRRSAAQYLIRPILNGGEPTWQ